MPKRATTRTRTPTSILTLPVEILRRIIDHLRWSDVLRLLRVSRRFNDVVVPVVYAVVTISRKAPVVPLDHRRYSTHYAQHVRHLAFGRPGDVPRIPRSFKQPELPSLLMLTLFGYEETSLYKTVVGKLTPPTLLLRDVTLLECNPADYLSPSALPTMEHLVLFVRHLKTERTPRCPFTLRRTRGDSISRAELVTSPLCDLIGTVPPRLASITLTFELQTQCQVLSCQPPWKHPTYHAFAWGGTYEYMYPSGLPATLVIFAQSILRICTGVIAELLSDQTRLPQLKDLKVVIPNRLMSAPCRALLLENVHDHLASATYDTAAKHRVKDAIQIVGGTEFTEAMAPRGAFNKEEARLWRAASDEAAASRFHVAAGEFEQMLAEDIWA